ncbi:MAG: helix-turn-helix transcriptional regulator [Immundisolibacteraceae bacterium]|nr:helix-turn-helix transcriptional regulator [Immundisolibacteraceae bacterium]
MSSLHEQLKKQRKALGLKQEDMELLIGMARQQYQRLESKGNPRLDTLELVAKGLKMELMLIPQAQLRAVRELLENSTVAASENSGVIEKGAIKKSLSDDPWQDLLGDDE